MNSYYQIWCFTNIDEFKQEKWPKFSEGLRPRIGETVAAESGRMLKVVAIVYSEEIREAADTRILKVGIELHR